MSSKKSIVFLGSKAIGYDCLKHLLDNQSVLNVEVIAALVKADHLLADEGKNILHLCEENDLVVLPNLDYLLDFESLDYLISVQYHQILKAEHLSVAKELALNLHMAPLPEYRGCNQFSFAIANEAKTFGTSIHVMNEDIDAGDLLFEKRFAMPEDVWVKDLYQLTVEASLELFKESLPKLLSGDYTARRQSSLLLERGSNTYFRNQIDDLKRIDLSWTKEKIARHIRATWFPPYDPPYYLEDGIRIIVGPDFIA